MDGLKISIPRDIHSGSTDDAMWRVPYPPHGQGIFTINISRRTPFELRVCPCSLDLSTQQWVSLIISRNKASLKLVGQDQLLLTERSGLDVGYNPDTSEYYWLSLDSSNLVVKYGKGYFMEETTILSFDFLDGLSTCDQIKKRTELRGIFGPCIQRFLEFHDFLTKENAILFEKNASIASNQIVPFTNHSQQARLELSSHVKDKVEFFPQPLIVNWPFAVKGSSEVSLFELDTNDYILSGSLPPECQELYTNISSAKIDLDWAPGDQKTRLSDAIRYSFETEGKTLYNKLKSKKMKYIRVTVGPSRSNSPGIPYVVELWPRNMGSPIHCHGNSYGVIKVLHGGIRVEIYNRDMKTKIKHFNVRKGDVTWMSPYWYQTHRLYNDTSDFSATIQCYRYGNFDTKQWPYFDYVSEKGCREEFLPNSDFTFTELYKTVLSEYNTPT